MTQMNMCNQCEMPYDLQNKLPKVLAKCGHTICQSCLKKLSCTELEKFKCPFDNIEYFKSEHFMRNEKIISLL